MERWNELAAGYVLGNLTESEQAELTAVLSKHPQLKIEIARLRKTATINRTQVYETAKADLSIENLVIGSQGWTDTASNFSGPPLPTDDGQIMTEPSALTLRLSPSRLSLSDVSSPDLAVSSVRAVSDESVISASRSTNVVNRLRDLATRVRAFWSSVSPWGWLMAFVLVGVGLDNWRMRRLLAISQERILQLELSAERSNVD